MRTLYHHWLSPSSRLVRIVLGEKRLDYALEVEKEWERRPAFLTMNPAGEVPVLVEDDGTTLADPAAIVEYLDDAYPTPPLHGTDAASRAEVRRLMAWFLIKQDQEVSRLLVGEKLLKRFLKMGQPDSATIRCAAHNIRTHLGYVDHLAEQRHYLAGDRFTLADAAAAAHFSVADYFGDVDWAAHKAAKDWYMRVKSRRSLRPLLADRIAGLLPPKHYDKLDL